ncbi:hypothetical protein A2T55_16185 [Brevibacterium linens]|uniref:Uncharacterized protein n=1 Tax=Brevibacterium linens TaxID=1703 RepID=A0A144MHR4_BRELN|nr:hypothetical protein A2T55_16185 [Brevibacterium linens]
MNSSTDERRPTEGGDTADAGHCRRPDDLERRFGLDVAEEDDDPAGCSQAERHDDDDGNRAPEIPDKLGLLPWHRLGRGRRQAGTCR